MKFNRTAGVTNLYIPAVLHNLLWLLLKKIFVILFALFISGCIKENIDNCLPRGKYLVFEILNQKYVFSEIIKTLDLYFYIDGDLVEKISFTKKELEISGYSVFIPYRQNNDYTILCLVNHLESAYIIKNPENFKTVNSKIRSHSGDTIMIKQPDLYHAVKEISFSDKDSTIMYDTLKLYKYTNDINLHIIVKDNSEQKIKIESSINGNNGAFQYSLNKCINNCSRTYIPYQHYDGFYKIKTMKMWIGDNLRISVKIKDAVTGEFITETNMMLTETLTNIEIDDYKPFDTNEKLELNDEYYIEIILNADNNYSILSVAINDWFVVQPVTDL